MNIKQATTLICLAHYLDLYNKRSHLTLLFSGVQGIGKSESLYLAANRVNGFAATVDGSVLNEGELPGIPFRTKAKKADLDLASYVEQVVASSKILEEKVANKEISKEQYDVLFKAISENLVDKNIKQEEKLEYAKYPVFAQIESLEEFYYNKAKTEGFDLPSGKLTIDENLNEIIINTDGTVKIIKEYNKTEEVADGGQNKWKFGSTLTAEDKIYLLKTNQIRPYFILFDELNRPDMRTMSEMMNVTLNRQISGYKLPFWVSIFGAQNPAGSDSDFATSTLDPAQLDRFCYIDMVSSLEDWAINELNNGSPEPFVSAVSLVGNDVFSPGEKKQLTHPTIIPSPRSNSIAAGVIKHLDKVLALPCFTDEDRKDRDFYLSSILFGLIGPNATNCLLTTMSDKENMLTIPEILTGKEPCITDVARTILKKKTSLGQKILAASLIPWLQQNWLRIIEWKKSTNTEEKTKYSNYVSQLFEFLNTIEIAVANWLLDKISATKFDCTDSKGNTVNVDLLYRLYDVICKNPALLRQYEASRKYVE